MAYALLNPTSPQTFTGSHNFPTQATSRNSTLAATTAYVKNQGYAVLGANNKFPATYSLMVQVVYFLIMD